MNEEALEEVLKVNILGPPSDEVNFQEVSRYRKKKRKEGYCLS